MALPRSLALCLLLCIALVGAGVGQPTPALAADEPTLVLTPNQAPCGTAITARGSSFPAGRSVEVVVSGGGAKPTGPPPIVAVTIAADGTFALDLTPCAAPGTAGDGAQYAVYAGTPQSDPFLPPDAAAQAIYTVGPVGQRPLPTLALAPESGACNGPAVASGANWFPGDILALTAFPVGSHSGVGFANVTVAPDGTFSLPFELHRATLCSSRVAPPLGAQYRIGVGPDLKRSQPRQDFASVTYTITQERLTERCFAETGRCVRGAFYERWERHGLAGNGFPLTEAFRQTLEDGNEYTVQYFERVRMELHPENQPPYDILLGQFGRRIVATVPGAPTAPAAPIAGGDYFAETGHNVDARFFAYWLLNGGLDQFGFPLTEPFEQRLEDGNLYRVQYFERARLEYHPENAGTPYEVLLGQFGRRIMEETQRPAPPPGSAAITPTRPDAPPGEPTYTEADVRAYLDRVGPPLIRLRVAGPYSVGRVAFLTGAEAERQWGVTLGPPDRLFCLAELRGTFTLTGPPPPPGEQPRQFTYTTVVVYFDGRTGNALGAQARP